MVCDLGFVGGIGLRWGSDGTRIDVERKQRWVRRAEEMSMVSRREFCKGAGVLSGLWWVTTSGTATATPCTTGWCVADGAEIIRGKVHVTGSGLQYQDWVVGEGLAVELGCECWVHYVARLVNRNGKPFDSTYARSQPWKVNLGRDHIIAGLEEGLLAGSRMRVGGRRRLWIPAELGYTDREVEPRPPDAGMQRRLYSTVFNESRSQRRGDLVFDLEIIRVRSVAPTSSVRIEPVIAMVARVPNRLARPYAVSLLSPLEQRLSHIAE
mmetsp:Transcript_14413/g.29488  ORF Transcript_14413/g.29488 Transcript_14413/m.29488 type:complete len:267 (+) Transcript_14413:54-854(+)